MKKLLGITILVAVMVTPAFSNLTVGTTEEFTGGLGEFMDVGGTVNAHNNYVTLGDPSGGDGNVDSTMAAFLEIGTGGIHTLSLDYRFPGYDTNPAPDAEDTVAVGVDIFGPGDILAFSWTTDLNFPQNDWTAASTGMDLATGTYLVYITHSETTASPILSSFDVDNILFSMGGTLPATSIPAPGAIFLGSIGAGLVGWLRRRKTL